MAASRSEDEKKRQNTERVGAAVPVGQRGHTIFGCAFGTSIGTFECMQLSKRIRQWEEVGDADDRRKWMRRKKKPGKATKIQTPIHFKCGAFQGVLPPSPFTLSPGHPLRNAIVPYYASFGSHTDSGMLMWRKNGHFNLCPHSLSITFSSHLIITYRVVFL